MTPDKHQRVVGDFDLLQLPAPGDRIAVGSESLGRVLSVEHYPLEAGAGIGGPAAPAAKILTECVAVE